MPRNKVIGRHPRAAYQREYKRRMRAGLVPGKYTGEIAALKEEIARLRQQLKARQPVEQRP